MTKHSTITLAIESAIAGGSISLLENDVELANWIGSFGISKAEDLLLNVDRLLRGQNLSAADVGLIAVSAGPGSFTGIRIGIATSLGLKKGLSVPLSSVPVLEAMAISSGIEDLTVAVPVGRGTICRQGFISGKAVGKPEPVDSDTFFRVVNTDEGGIYLLHTNLYEKAGPASKVLNAGANLALPIGKLALSRPGVLTEPLFISKAI